jgi:hypothetical protein
MNNQSAIQVSKKPEHHSHMKHLDLAHSWLQNEVAKGSFGIEYVSAVDKLCNLVGLQGS